MIGKRIKNVLALCALGSTLLLAQDKPSYLRFQEWGRWDDGMRTAYVIGYVDGRSMIIVDKEHIIMGLPIQLKCLEGMTYGQEEAIVDKYYKNNPEQWNLSIAGGVMMALGSVCNPPKASKAEETPTVQCDQLCKAIINAPKQ